MQIENYEVYSIELQQYTLTFNPKDKSMFIDYITDEGEDFQVLIYDELGYHLEDSLEKDVEILEKYKNMFETYVGDSK